jgi:hypothetical protein
MNDERPQPPLRPRTAVAAALAAGPLALFLTPALAQPFEQCTISILNRTARVRPDGSWRINNVPAGFGLVRARMTCVAGGMTRSGQSAFFTIEENAVTGFDRIVLGALEPVPERLEITAPAGRLTSELRSMQLSVAAVFADGSRRNATAAAAGTSYRVSNPAVAAVSAGGLVTARLSGTVLVSAMNEGALGVLRLEVVLAADSDGDGIPDDLEIALGLDPNNPIDALEDFDGDGLTNREEVALGTAIRNADSDGDGIPDGEEVVPGADGFVTNPLLADTDGDGIRDGLEIATGTDPTDPASFSLERALRALEVSPEAVVLTFNTVLGEASRQLTVTGKLRDDTDIDLTSRARGTSYGSSDLAVVSFGAEDGRIFAGREGQAQVTVRTSGFSAVVHVVVRSFAPQALSFLDLPGFANNVDVAGGLALVAAGAAGLQVIDATDPSAPRIVGAADTPGNANDVKVAGELALVADGAAGLQVVSIADPRNPRIVGSLDTPGIAQDVVVAGDRLYVADGAGGLRVLRLDGPRNPVLLGSLVLPGEAKGVDVDPKRRLAVVAAGTSGLHAVDLADETRPQLLSSLATGDARDVALRGSFAFVADLAASLVAVDLADPRVPARRGSTPRESGGLLTDGALAGELAFGADVFFANGVPIFHLGLPASPAVRGFLDFSRFRDDNGTGIAADGNFVYLTASQGLVENGTSGATRLYIGQYLATGDDAGIPPEVMITAPADGAMVTAGAQVMVEVEASDDVGVAVVQLLVDGELRSADASAPYRFDLEAPAAAKRLRLQAAAIDLGGNRSLSAEVTLRVAPDPLTTVAGRVVGRDGAGLPGVEVETLGRMGATGAGGRFSLPGVPTARGDIVVTARGEVEGQNVIAQSAPAAPVPRGVTDVGNILLEARRGPLYPGLMRVVSSFAAAFLVTDLDGDGIADAVQANPAPANSVSVLLGDGEGGFGEEMSFAVAACCGGGLVALDLDGDGALDLATTHGSSIRVHLARAGGFVPGSTLSVPNAGSLAAGDVDGDGDLDLAAYNTFPEAASVFLNRGGGDFDPERQVPAPAFSFQGRRRLAVADLSGDGLDDLVTANQAPNVSVYRSTGGGTFAAERNFPAGTAESAARQLAVEDLNADGALDVVTGNPAFQAAGAGLSILLGNGDGTLRPQVLLPGRPDGPRAIAIGDLDGGGALDLFAFNSTGDVLVYAGAGDGSFAAARRFPTGDNQSVIAGGVGDGNADGTLDAVVFGPSSAGGGWAVWTLFGLPAGELESERRYAAVGRSFEGDLALADLDGDARLDAVATEAFTGSGQSSNRVFILGGAAAGLELSRTLTLEGRQPGAVVAADLDGDGALDLATANGETNDLSVLAAGGGFAEELHPAGVSFPQGLAAADVDGNGILDLVTKGFNFNSPLSVLPGLGGGDFGAPLLSPSSAGNRLLGLADLDGDGSLDALIHSNFQLATLLGEGDGGFAGERRFDVGQGIVAAALLDADQDGAMDVAAVGGASWQHLSLLLGAGDGTFAQPLLFFVDFHAATVEAADVDLDGLVDAIVGRPGAVSVLAGGKGGAFGPEQRFASVGGKVLAVGDIDRDGAPDIAVIAGGTGEIGVLFHR